MGLIDLPSPSGGEGTSTSGVQGTHGPGIPIAIHPTTPKVLGSLDSLEQSQQGIVDVLQLDITPYPPNSPSDNVVPSTSNTDESTPNVDFLTVTTNFATANAGYATSTTSSNLWFLPNPVVRFVRTMQEFQRSLEKDKLVQLQNKLNQIGLTLILTQDLVQAIKDEAQLQYAQNITKGILSIAGAVAAPLGAAVGAKFGNAMAGSSLVSGLFGAAGNFVDAYYVLAEAGPKALQEILRTYIQLTEQTTQSAAETFKNDSDLLNQVLDTLSRMIQLNQQAQSFNTR